MTIRSNLHLPNGGEREGAEVHWQGNLSLPLGKARMGYPTGEARWGLMSLAEEVFDKAG